MTQQEKKREEIRLLNLRVDELKAQNEHYSVASDELKVKKSNFEKEIEGISAECATLSEVRDSMKKEVADTKKILSDKKEEIKKLQEKLEKVEAEYSLVNANNIKEQRRKDELVYEIGELEKKLDATENEVASKFASLKGFEEQLLIKEGLLVRREEILDLKEKGVNL